MTKARSDAASPRALVPLTGPRLRALLAALGERLAHKARLFLVGESALVAAGLQEWTDRLGYTVEAEEPAAFERAIHELAAAHGVALERESPADVLPLPPGFEGRARPIDGLTSPSRSPSRPRLEVLRFDPVSVALRLVARGDEPDYRTVLACLRYRWLTMDELEDALAEALPRFSADRIQQDPAEFRRKFKGLTQMWRALPAGDRLP